ncbi:hypothetical protein [Mycolicibacterium wolinskyi]|uniref:hypothetical protein n=1 Tax=Mycolicibacterium wolinskyi TaxID=59750 RepID=UPI003BAD2601
MIALLDRLAVEVLGELGQVGVIEINSDRNILLRSSEFAADLILDQGVEFRVDCAGRCHADEDIAGQNALSAKVDLIEVSFT